MIPGFESRCIQQLNNIIQQQNQKQSISTISSSSSSSALLGRFVVRSTPFDGNLKSWTGGIYKYIA